MPPRPLTPGDVVVAFSDELEEWTAAQITGVDARSKTVGVLELDWSGPAPASLADLGALGMLRDVSGRPVHRRLNWVLPRSYRVIGTVALLNEDPPTSTGFHWQLGRTLASRRRSAARASVAVQTRYRWLTGEELNRRAVNGSDDDVDRLIVTEIEHLDCGVLAERFPHIVGLSLWGLPGTLSNVAALRSLSVLQLLTLGNLFGMSAREVLTPSDLPLLESLELKSVPADFGLAMYELWRDELERGTDVAIDALRTPEWVDEHVACPLARWTGRTGLDRGQAQKTMGLYRLARDASRGTLLEGVDDRAVEFRRIGREFSLALNRLEARRHFIGELERFELLQSLTHIAGQTASASQAERDRVAAALRAGADAVRDW